MLIFVDLGFLYCPTTLAPMISLNPVAFLHPVAQLAACRNVDAAAGSYPELFAPRCWLAGGWARSPRLAR